jgi:hypothetical protein
MVDSKIEIKTYVDVLVFCKRAVSMVTVYANCQNFLRNISVILNVLSNIQQKHVVINISFSYDVILSKWYWICF